jgi:hypothetical protein
MDPSGKPSALSLQRSAARVKRYAPRCVRVKLIRAVEPVFRPKSAYVSITVVYGPIGSSRDRSICG